MSSTVSESSSSRAAIEKVSGTCERFPTRDDLSHLSAIARENAVPALVWR
jgi:hypothetical protein